jgi:ribulose-phosphate 3-epimerase
MAITTIAPTILTNDPNEYNDIVKKYFNFAKRVHVDISDGTLTDATTISETAVWWPKGWTVDIHMITATPSTHLDNLIKLKPNLVIFHAEANEDLLPIFQKLHEAGIKTGVAIIKSVYPGNIKNILNDCDHALIFSGDLGKYGGKAEPLLFEKAALIRDIKSAIEIGWDGGANEENIHLITHAGVDVINVGSAIAKAEDSAAAFNTLNKLTEKEEAV